MPAGSSEDFLFCAVEIDSLLLLLLLLLLCSYCKERKHKQYTLHSDWTDLCGVRRKTKYSLITSLIKELLIQANLSLVRLCKYSLILALEVNFVCRQYGRLVCAVRLTH